ncbi:MAG: hypothetical protein AAGI23_02430 [Bacteroidota bacterium]
MLRPLFFLLFVLPTLSYAQQKMTVQIPANDVVVLTYADHDYHDVTLKNKSLKGIEVNVLAANADEALRGFGLGTKGKATVMVEKESRLMLRNPTNNPIKVKVKVDEGSAPVQRSSSDYVSFTLRNGSAKPIPLLIPSVMNPNLSPFSNSGVELKMGQEILFKENGKRYVLLTVDNSIAAGEVIEVASLLKARKKELGL